MTSELGTLGILVLDDEPNVRRAIARLELGPAMRVHAVGTTAEADALIATGAIDVALVDQHLGAGQMSGLAWLDRLRAGDPDCFRIIFTGAGDLDFAVRAINGGVIDAFLTKPWSDEQALALMHQGAEACLLRRHNRALLHELSQRNTDLLSFNENLERLVEERTHNLREAHERVKQQQQAMIRLETQGVVNHLARGLAHELNNPLAVILGYTQRLKRGGGEPDVVRRLDVILAEVERCRGLVDQLRRIAAPLDEETVSVSPSAQLDDVLTARRDAGLGTPRLQYRRPLPAVVAAPAALRRVLAEIVDNAMRAGATQLTLDGEVAFGRATLRLGNDGVKPSQSEAENATKPFFTTRSAEGARGLGLAVAAGLLNDQEGHLELQVDEAGCALVVIQLPAATAPVAAGHRSVSPRISGERAILVVDDDALVGELLADMLHDLQYRVVLARTCGEARARLAEGRFMALLTDQHLPDGSGADLLDEYADAGLPGAMITGDIPTGSRHHVLGKPFRYEQVAELLRSLGLS